MSSDPTDRRAAAQATDPTQHTGPLELSQRGEGQRALVVDDNEDGAEMLAFALSMKGYDTRIAYDAPTALNLAAAFSPHIAFLDIGLPMMDGYELASHLRKIPGLAHVRLVAVTGYGRESDRKKVREAGFHYHIVKPIDLDILDAAVMTRA